jgi:hypothetical protein
MQKSHAEHPQILILPVHFDIDAVSFPAIRGCNGAGLGRAASSIALTRKIVPLVSSHILFVIAFESFMRVFAESNSCGKAKLEVIESGSDGCVDTCVMFRWCRNF